MLVVLKSSISQKIIFLNLTQNQKTFVDFHFLCLLASATYSSFLFCTIFFGVAFLLPDEESPVESTALIIFATLDFASPFFGAFGADFKGVDKLLFYSSLSSSQPLLPIALIRRRNSCNLSALSALSTVEGSVPAAEFFRVLSSRHCHRHTLLCKLL